MVSEIYSKSILQYRAYRARMQCVLILSLGSLQTSSERKADTGEGSKEMLVLGWEHGKQFSKLTSLKPVFLS